MGIDALDDFYLRERNGEIYPIIKPENMLVKVSNKIFEDNNFPGFQKLKHLTPLIDCDLTEVL